MARPRSKKRSWRQGQKPKTQKFFKKQAHKEERADDKRIEREAERSPDPA
jgi:hypothetical protein